MAIKKSELYSSLWASCDKLRGGMDASQYKDYVLVILFMKYVTDKYGSRDDAPVYIPKGGSFNDLVALKHNPEIGDKINQVIKKLADENMLSGVIDVADFDDSDKLGSGKEKVDKLSDLIAIFESDALDFSGNIAEGDDILGDAYEYLMRHFASESGKSKGQFYTPAEVSRIMAKVIGIDKAKKKSQTVYDPTCGSGSLLLRAAAETKHGITIYGQENDVATRALAVMNMWLHENPEAEIWRGNTISDPYFKDSERTLKTFDFIVANPPFSTKSWMGGIDPENDVFGRFEGFGIPPKKNGDYAFLLHIVRSLKSTGKGAVILPHGVLFRGNGEAKIRKNLIKRGYIKGIVGLPPNLFYGTGIPACIIVLDKEGAENRKGIFMIDASRGFVKDGNKNRLRERDIHKIVDTFTNELELPKYSRLVPVSEIEDEKNDYNLNIPRYIDSQEEEDKQDIEAHLKGDIPQRDIDDLDTYWQECPNLQKELFKPSARKGYFTLKLDASEIKEQIFTHKDFKQYRTKVENAYRKWSEHSEPKLKALSAGLKPKEIIYDISEGVLQRFDNLSLIDKYAIYQHLMTYWFETMQDDAYMIAIHGWKVQIEIEKTKAGKEKGWSSKLLPKSIVTKEFFADQQQAIDKLQLQLENAAQKMQELEEEHSGEEDFFSEARSSTGKITKKDLASRIKEIRQDTDYEDELKVLKEYESLLAEETKLKSELKNAEESLDKSLRAKYQSLTEKELKNLVVEDKWLSTMHQRVLAELERVAHGLSGRIKELAERYEKPLPELTAEVKELKKKVEGHLKKMGFEW